MTVVQLRTYATITSIEMNGVGETQIPRVATSAEIEMIIPALVGPSAVASISDQPGNALTGDANGGLYVATVITPDGGVDLTLIFDNQLM